MPKKIAVGIDLGTSNCAVATQVIDNESRTIQSTEVGSPENVPITQAVAPGQLETLDLLPSAIYISTDEEVAGDYFKLPWQQKSARYLLGKAARERGATLADRVITSAKSWLCHDKVDRNADILPWQSDLKDHKVSPVVASHLFLEQLKDNLLRHLAQHDVTSLAECEVTVTVPASFDEVARSLTVEAAETAGLKSITLLEEPLAALYSWISANGSAWRKSVSPGDLVLVCDVGGGTADFSLIAVTETNGDLGLDRISVGDHILLGGDNMDLALAFSLRSEILEKQNIDLDEWQFQALVHLARNAKERLLEDTELESLAISIPSRGSDLFAENISTNISQADVHRIIEAGFFPETPITSTPARQRQAGLREMGLPYAADPALTKHLAHFLTKSLERFRADPNGPALQLAEDAQFLAPTAVLFNGGVFNSHKLRTRMLEIIRSWCPDPVTELHGIHRDKAVAQGAAAYAAIKASGQGLRIRSGTTRSYYIGIESAAPAVPGFTHPIKGVCVLPHGTEEGTELAIEDLEFSLYTGEESQFRLFSSADRPADPAGHSVKDAERELEESAPIHSCLPPVQDNQTSELVNVKLHAKVTEVGVLELWMQHTESSARWKLEFNLRPTEA